MRKKSKTKPLLRTIVISLVLFAAVATLTVGIAAAQSATRTLPDEPVLPGANFDVGIEALDYGMFGQVIETLPEGFTYVGSPLEEDDAVEVVDSTVKLTFLEGEGSFTYTVTASSVAGTYTFSGTLKDEDKNESAVGGDTQRVAVALPTVAINELLPNPVGPDAEGEFIELYNYGDYAADITGWILKDAIGATKTYTITGMIDAGEFLVFWRNETGIVLNNDGDKIYLNDSTGTNVDSFNYTSSTDGKPWARIPDGTGEWEEAEDPTPGASNSATSELPKTGDINDDGEVNFDDVILLAEHCYFGDTVYADPDVNSDGEVNFDDVILLAEHCYFGDPIYP